MTTRVTIDFEDQADAQRFVNWVEEHGQVYWDLVYDDRDHADVSLVHELSDVIPTPPETPEQARARIMRERKEDRQQRMREELAEYVKGKSGGV